MASSSAACTLAGARLTSSASTRLANTGPGWNLNSPFPPSVKYTSEPVMSAGRRSGVNWMRENWASRFFARLLIARVFASPGSPSTRRLPLARRPSRRRSIIASWPMIEAPIRFLRSRIPSRALMRRVSLVAVSDLHLPQEVAEASREVLVLLNLPLRSELIDQVRQERRQGGRDGLRRETEALAH